jgi:hypothetical protein
MRHMGDNLILKDSLYSLDGLPEGLELLWVVNKFLTCL